MTNRQRECWEVLIRLTADGWPVTVRKFGEAMGYTSSASAHRMLVRLEELGLAERRDRKGWRAT